MGTRQNRGGSSVYPQSMFEQNKKQYQKVSAEIFHIFTRGVVVTNVPTHGFSLNFTHK